MSARRRPETVGRVVRLTEEEALARGEPTPQQLAAIDDLPDEDIARQITQDAGGDLDVRVIRETLASSRRAFADVFGLPVATLRPWEQGRRRPSGASLTLLRLLEAEPEGVMRVCRKASCASAGRRPRADRRYEVDSRFST